MKLVLLAALSAALVVGCNERLDTTQSEPTQTQVEATAPENQLDAWWLDVPGGETQRPMLEEYAAAKDCAGLQATFDIWASADPFSAQGDLLEYIDELLESSGCYQ